MQDQLLDCNSNITVCVCVAETITIHARSSDSDAPHRDVTRCLSCARKHVVGKEVSPALGREPFPLMQGRAVAKLAMKASCRQCLHEPRRRPQSTFIVVRHLHFLGNRGFGARNELCSHIDYSPLFSRLNGEGALVAGLRSNCKPR
jgi:hypothetical protein